MRTFRYVSAAISAALCAFAVTPAGAAPAALGTGLREISAAYDKGDNARAQSMMRLTLRSRTGDPMVRVHLESGVKADAVLAQLAAAGFRLQTKSTINPSLVEGYLPLAAVHRAAGVVRREDDPCGAAAARQRRLGAEPGRGARRRPTSPRRAASTGRASRSPLFRTATTPAAICAAPTPPRTSPPATCPQTASFVLPGQDLPVGQGEDEGRAMLQLIHDIAPGAQLGFASAFISELQFAENILGLRSQFGADVICDDVIYFDEPMYSDGILAQAVEHRQPVGRGLLLLGAEQRRRGVRVRLQRASRSTRRRSSSARASVTSTSSTIPR